MDPPSPPGFRSPGQLPYRLSRRLLDPSLHQLRQRRRPQRNPIRQQRRPTPLLHHLNRRAASAQNPRRAFASAPLVTWQVWRNHQRCDAGLPGRRFLLLVLAMRLLLQISTGLLSFLLLLVFWRSFTTGLVEGISMSRRLVLSRLSDGRHGLHPDFRLFDRVSCLRARLYSRSRGSKTSKSTQRDGESNQMFIPVRIALRKTLLLTISVLYVKFRLLVPSSPLRV
jgi:hypothetical protein